MWHPLSLILRESHTRTDRSAIDFTFKENISKIRVFAGLIKIICSIMEGQLIDGILSLMVEYLCRHCISSSLVVIIVHGQQPPRLWSTIKIRCHHSPQSGSTISCHLDRGPPPLLDPSTILYQLKFFSNSVKEKQQRTQRQQSWCNWVDLL